MNGHPALVLTPPPTVTLTARLRRAMLRAVLVGLVATFVSLAPALFIQSVVSDQTATCDQAVQRDVPVSGLQQPNCYDDVAAAALWLGPFIIAGGALLGFTGGFLYGFFEANLRYNHALNAQDQWLPF